jgi:hypothetical protein
MSCTLISNLTNDDIQYYFDNIEEQLNINIAAGCSILVFVSLFNGFIYYNLNKQIKYLYNDIHRPLINPLINRDLPNKYINLKI